MGLAPLPPSHLTGTRAQDTCPEGFFSNSPGLRTWSPWGWDATQTCSVHVARIPFLFFHP